MIIGKISNLYKYAFRPEIKKIADYATSTELNRLCYGIHEVIDGVKMLVDNYKCQEDSLFIGHEKKFEVHIVTDGIADYEYADVNDDSVRFVDPYNEETDTTTYKGEAKCRFTLDNTMFLIVMPSDIIKYEIRRDREHISKVVWEVEL